VVAWLFPGQGSQEVGMGRDLWEHSAAARAIFETADEVLGFPLSEICFDGPEERLRDTRVTQPAIVAVSLASVAAALEAGAIRESPAVLAGHSVGEYAALIVAGAVSLEDGLGLVGERARLMSEAGEVNPGTLAAIIGLDEAAVRRLTEEEGADVCNLNLPNQTVVGGPHAAVEAIVARAKELGALRAIELNVSGAFHSRLMQSAQEGMAEALAGVSLSTPMIPVVGNVSAEPLASPAEIRAELVTQVSRPVRWHQSVTWIVASGVTTFIEFGSGRVLTGMIKRLVPAATLINVSRFSDTAVGAAEA
jgi:[acyl-carrier-protein] S-malonyltransferase